VCIIPISATAGYVAFSGTTTGGYWLNWVDGTASGYNPLTLIHMKYWPDSDTPTGPYASYIGFCTDPTTSGLPGHVVVESALKDFMGDRGLKAAWLWQQHFASLGTDDVKISALQAAIWEVMCESTSNPYSVSDTSSVLYISSTSTEAMNVKAQADLWLADVPALIDPMAVSGNIRVLDETIYQPFVIETPEPATMTILGVGAVILFRGRRFAA